MKDLVSPQYLRKEKIYVTIVEVKSPVHYVIKESPSLNTTCTYASKFLELEDSMQKYYGSLERTFFQLPVKDTVLVVEHEKKYYRAKVCSILNLPRSYLIKVYLLDYGKECSVPKSSLFEMHPDFMSVPFQVIDFKLPGLEPMSFVMNPFDLTVDYGTATEWDPSASTFIRGKLKALHNAFVKVEGATKNCIFGTLHVTLPDGEENCVNDELVFKKFASQNPEGWNNITTLAEILSKENLSNSDVPQRGFSEAPKSPCNNSKSLPVSELSSPESVKSPVTSTIMSEPLKNGQKCGVAKLRAILRAKKSQEQSKTLTSSEEKKEVQTQSNAERKSLEHEDVIREIEESKAVLLDVTKDVFTVNETMEDVDKHSTVRESVLKITDMGKCDKSVSVSPNGSAVQKFRKLLAKKRAVQKQQNIPQILTDNSCSDCPSHSSQSEMDLHIANAHSLESIKSENFSPVLNISTTESEGTGSNLPQSVTAYKEFEKTEKFLHQPANSTTVQKANISEIVPLVKSDSEQSVGSQVSSPEQKEVSKKVDPAKVRAFYERNRKARAKFLAQKNLNNVNSQMPMTSLSKSSETEIPLVATEEKNVGKEGGTTKLSETQAKLIITSTQNVIEESYKDNSGTNQLELAKSSDGHCKSMESQTTSESKEIAKLKVDPGKVKKFFEQSRKTRAKFLAQAKSKQDQNNESSLLKMTSPPLVDCKPSKTERELTAGTPDIMNAEKSCGKDSDIDILELAHDSSDSNCTSPKSDRYAESETESLLLIQQEPLESIDFGGKSLFEKQKVPALCIGEGVPTPVLSVNEITFHPSIKKTLEKLNFEGPSCIQSVVWPAALRSRSLAAIAPPHSGKSVAYLLPIVSNLLNKLYIESPNSKGPLAIIICSSWRKVQHIYDLLQLFLKDTKFKILTYFADGRSKRNRVISLVNGCDILISVPSILLNFLNENSVCVKRCCHFILDDGANLLSSHMNEMKRIMEKFGEAIKLRPTISARLQILINSERWTKAVASFVDKFLREPLLLFTSFLEAAIYRQIPMFPHVCSESDKNQKLVEIVKTCGKRTIICTQDVNKASTIHTFLQSEHVRSFLVTEEMEHYISDGVIRDWKCINSGLPYCLIVTDPALTGMTLCDANYVIHYDVPEISRLQFGNRFGCIAEHFQKSDVTDCGSHILISETCTLQAVPILKIIKRNGMDVPKDLIDLVNKQKKVTDNPDAPLCKYFKAFGLCKLPHCEKRHHVNSAVDQPKVIFKEGDVHAKVTHMFDASHFYVRVMKHIPPDCQQPSSLSGEYADMGLKLKNFYTVESNRKVVECPVIGGNYIIQYGNDFFYRIKVMDITKLLETDSRKITILFRDDGIIQSHDGLELYEDLTCDDFPPPHAVEVFLCNVATPDSCLDWNPQTNHFVKKLVMDKEIHGKIVLCLGETLWLHPLVLREKLAFNNDYLNVLTVDKSLKDAEFAIENENHLPLLFKACKNKIQLPNQKSSRPPEKVIHEDLKIQVAHAFLELNVYEDVYVSSVISPHQFYVQRVKFVDCLNELLEKINAQVDAKILKKCSTLLNGMHCIAPFSMDNRYYRALVTNVSSDSEDVNLFFVDFGDSCCAPKDSIFILPPEFTLLPFQAIECELDGIRAPHGGWSDKAADLLEDLTRDESNDMKIVEIKAYTKLTSYDTGNRYKVDVWNGEKTLSEQLLAEGLVDPDEKFVVDEAANETDEDKDFIEEVPDGFSLSSDEDLPSENKDHHALFCAALSKMLLQNKSNSEAIDEVVNELVKSREQKKFKMGVEEIAINANVDESVIKDASIVNSPVAALQRLLNFKKKKENSKKIRPTILWWDSSEYVHILLKLKDIQLYELDLKDDGFIFKTSLRGVDYYAEEQFYGAVHSKDCNEKNGLGGLSIVLKKQVEERWSRLIKENKKLPYIKYDLEHIDVSDSEDIAEDNIGAPLNESSSVNTEIDYTPDEDDDSTDDEKSIPDWKQLAEFKDPYNPME
ncbi:unnamed protein product [Larinioides sclopetarius]|uniref:Probable ATP-dependent RNA helicase spindle-E n=1 Tax=Larinioides sclopetarius TaxID=280406 RepID=A0AAV2A5H5_9ARAC